ncbi:MAG TPA: hypothetical protein VET26_04820 [Candidatus Sulfotelmatobacter sp.]|nr:hypothetical protein [Candidatus Sulfotelmatobacter sp.]
MVTRGVNLHEATFEPRGTALDERDPVGAQAMGQGAPGRVDRRRATGQPVGDELLGSRQQAHVEGLAFEHGRSCDGLTFEADQDHRWVERDGNQAARRHRAVAGAVAGADHHDPRRQARHDVPELTV